MAELAHFECEVEVVGVGVEAGAGAAAVGPHGFPLLPSRLLVPGDVVVVGVGKMAHDAGEWGRGRGRGEEGEKLVRFGWGIKEGLGWFGGVEISVRTGWRSQGREGGRAEKGGCRVCACVAGP